MAVEMLVGLNVIDDEAYQSYRKEMLPILLQHGGGFNYDFRVSEVLISKTESPVNRVFTIYFESEELKNAFFSHPDYLKVKKKFYNGAVAHTTIIASYQVQ